MIKNSSFQNDDGLKCYNLIFITSLIPPDHSGAGKRIYKFYKHLKNKNITVDLITQSQREDRDDNIHILKSIRLNSKNSKPYKFETLINFLFVTFQLLILSRSFETKLGKKNFLWLTSCNLLTFSSSIIFSIKGYRIITQNVQLGADDPKSKYSRDLFLLKYGMKRLQYYLSDVVTSNSPALYNATKKYYKNTVMIPNPVNLKEFKNHNDIKERRLKKRILMVGKISYRKGSDIALRTICEIHKIDPDIEFNFIGPVTNLKKIMDTENISKDDMNMEKVNFAGFVSDPTSYYLNSSLLFFPSRLEGCPNAVLEAMAAGLPVVAKHIPNITDYIFGDNYTKRFDTDDGKVFAQEIISLLNDNQKYVRAVGKSLKEVQKFEEQSIYKEYHNLIVNSF